MSDSSLPSSPSAPSFWQLWRQFLPLSVSDITMAGSEPLVATTLAHMPDPRTTLAALGVSKAIAILLESPIIMVLHASNALAASARARAALLKLVLLMSATLTLLLAGITLTPLFAHITGRWMGVDAAVQAAGWPALLILTAWPAAIAWRRYVQGLLIAGGAGGVVGRAGIGRISVVALALLAGYHSQLPGATVGAAALMAGVFVESCLVTLGAWRRGTFASAPAEPSVPAGTVPELPTDVSGVWGYYRPLASSMLVVWGGRAAMFAIIARAVDAPVALAAWPAAWSLVTVIANTTRMVQQLTIRHQAYTPLRRLLAFATSVGAACSALVLLVATPPGAWALAAFLGHDASLIEAARPTVLFCALIPLLVAWQNASQGLLIARGLTPAVQRAAWWGVGSGLAVAGGAIALGAPGAASAAAAMALGYAVEVGVLAWAWRLNAPEAAQAAA
ncbi:MAG: hypothetical protein VKP62_12380 [Candidatus Sericytochromatia bacterium]|nr:hypothetical protein [Candidatus Sericytochromatia bacterium]